MKRSLFFATVSIWLALAGYGAAQSPSLTQGDRLIAASFDNATFNFQRGEYRSAFQSLQVVMEPEVYRQLSTKRQFEVVSMFGVSANQIGERALAHSAFVTATNMPGADDLAWVRRLHAAVAIGDGTDTAVSFNHLATRDVVFMQSFGGRDIDHFDQLIGQLPNALQSRLAFGRQLEKEAWRPAFPYDDPSNIWLHYVQALLESGDIEKAKLIAARITNPMIISVMLCDPRLDVVVAANPQLQDPQAAAGQYLLWARELAAESPRYLGARVAEVRALAILNRHAEALALIDDLMNVISRASQSAPPFMDMYESQAVEMWRNSLLVSVGRADEAIGARTAMAVRGGGVLPLARTLIAAERPREALTWLGNARPYTLGLHDQMDAHALGVCASAQLGDEAGVARGLAILREHERWKPDALVGALVCVDDLDAAAATLTSQLGDEKMRLAALQTLQTYTGDQNSLPFDKVMEARWVKLKARPEIVALATKYGQVRSFNIAGWDSVS